MTSKISKLYDHVNYQFREELDRAFFAKFQIQIETFYSIGACRVVSARVDDKKLTKPQREWINVFEAGYTAAMEQIHENNCK